MDDKEKFKTMRDGGWSSVIPALYGSGGGGGAGGFSSLIGPGTFPARDAEDAKLIIERWKELEASRQEDHIADALAYLKNGTATTNAAPKTVAEEPKVKVSADKPTEGDGANTW